MSFEAKLAKRTKCQCWDCLRRDGLTPPRPMADKHPDITGGKHRSDGKGER